MKKTKVKSNLLRDFFQDFTKRSDLEKRKVKIEIIRFIDSSSSEIILDEINTQLHELNKDRVTPTYDLILLIDFLIDATNKFYDSKRIKIFYNYLQVAITNYKYKNSDSNLKILKSISTTLGKLARKSAIFRSLQNEWISFELKRALEWLENKKDKRIIAIHVIKELAKNCPTFFFKNYVSRFLNLVWIGLRDSNEILRSSSLEALTPVLVIISERQTPNRIIWYNELMKEIEKGFSKKSTDYIQASIMVTTELLCHSGLQFLKSCRYQICKATNDLLSSRDKMIKKRLLSLLPIISKKYNNYFNEKYFNDSINFLMKSMKSGSNRGAALICLGKICSLNVDEVKKNTKLSHRILTTIKEGIRQSSKKRPIHRECLTCLKFSVEGLKDQYFSEISELIQKNRIFSHGLSIELIECLKSISKSIPKLLRTIQMKLIDIVSFILTKSPMSSINLLDKYSASFFLTEEDFSDNSKILALKVLSGFDLGSYNLGQLLLSEHLLQYLDSENPSFRKEAAKACCKLLLPESDNRNNFYQEEEIPPNFNYVGEVFQKLMILAISDSDKEVKITVLKNLDERYDEFLFLTQNLRLLFVSTHDEELSIRKEAIKIIGRLSEKKSAFVVALLRRNVFQLLSQLSFSEDMNGKLEASVMIGNLIKASSTNIKPYFSQIYKVLHKILIKNENVDVVESVLKTIGILSYVDDGKAMKKYLNEILPLVIENLKDKSNPKKRSFAVKTLGEIIKNTGEVIKPYENYPSLLSILGDILRTDDYHSTRIEVLKVLGIIGPIDPFSRKIIEDDLVTKDNIETGLQKVLTVEQLVDEMSPLKEDYYHQIAILALMKILIDPTMKKLHFSVVSDVVLIFESMGIKCVPYLKQVLRPILDYIRKGEFPDTVLIDLLKQLEMIIKVVKHHIRKYVEEILLLTKKFWKIESTVSFQLINIQVTLSKSLNYEFSKYVHLVIPPLLTMLRKDRSEGKKYSVKAVKALKVFACYSSDYLHMIVPILVSFYETCEYNPQKLVIESVNTGICFLLKLDAFEYSERIIHPLAKLLEHNNQVYLKLALTSLKKLAIEMSKQYIFFIPIVKKYIGKIPKGNINYEIRRLLKEYNDVISPKRSEPSFYYIHNTSTPMSVNKNKLEKPKKKFIMNLENLRRAWYSQNNSVKEDWIEWFKIMTVELLKENPNSSFRFCSNIAQIHQTLPKDLFRSSFFSVYTGLKGPEREEMFRSLQIAFSVSLDLPSEVLLMLLQVIEFMEVNENPLPVDIATIGYIARKCHLFEMALYYKEKEFKKNPKKHLQELVNINRSLDQNDAMLGNVRFASTIEEGLYDVGMLEKMGKWKKALELYNSKEENFETIPGKMRCLMEIGEWESLSNLAHRAWKLSEVGENKNEEFRRIISRVSAQCAFVLKDWELLEETVSYFDNDFDGNIFKIVLSIRSKNYVKAKKVIEETRFLIDMQKSEVNKLDRMVNLQQLTEIEEIIEVMKINNMKKEKKKSVLKKIKQTWKLRLKYLLESAHPSKLRRILSIREIIFSKNEMIDEYIQLAKLERLRKNFSVSENLYNELLPEKERSYFCKNENISNHLGLSFIDHLYDVGKKKEAIDLLSNFLQTRNKKLAFREVAESYVKLGKWTFSLALSKKVSGDKFKKKEKNVMSDSLIRQTILTFYEKSTIVDSDWYVGWNYFGNFCEKIANNLEREVDDLLIQLKFIKKKKEKEESLSPVDSDDEIVLKVEETEKSNQDQEDDIKKQIDLKKSEITTYLCSSLSSYFKSISLSPKGIKSKDTLINLLRILTLWFNYSDNKKLIKKLIEGYNEINVNLWLNVIPQIIARINTEPLVSRLLKSIGEKYPQALVYPLYVCFRSSEKKRRICSQEVLDNLRTRNDELIKQALLVSNEMIRIGILWPESWITGLNEVLKLYVDQYDVKEIWKVLKILYHMIKTPQTSSETQFIRNYGQHLQKAWNLLKKYESTNNQDFLGESMSVYHSIYTNLCKNLEKLLIMDLNVISPKLIKMKNLELCIPGSYIPPYETTETNLIGGFVAKLELLGSKRRPRKMKILNQKGEIFLFLLKGNEDSRQDERVMQLFGLVNHLLRNDVETRNHFLSITRYSVVPLSNSVGCSSWVWNSLTLKEIVKEMREAKGKKWDLEKDDLEVINPHYDHLTVMQKIEAFQRIMHNKSKDELHVFLLTKSKSFKVWNEKRETITKSLAVMSVIGYFLGLGDRHPSNLMIEKHTGKIVHCDFGDCFEIAMNREHVPEKVPFRLTKMLTTAMEANGALGSFTEHCVRVNLVMRKNKNSLMTMLEAFVHDPLINWRLIEVKYMNREAKYNIEVELSDEVEKMEKYSYMSSRSYREREIKRYERLYTNDDEEEKEMSKNGKNKLSLKVIKRIKQKLEGKDFGKKCLSERSQVNKLIEQATSEENLSQNFLGWCSFW